MHCWLESFVSRERSICGSWISQEEVSMDPLRALIVVLSPLLYIIYTSDLASLSQSYFPSKMSHAAPDHDLQKMLHCQIQPLRVEFFSRKTPHIRVGLVANRQ